MAFSRYVTSKSLLKVSCSEPSKGRLAKCRRFISQRIHGTGICTYIYHKSQPNVGKYAIHGSYGYHKLTSPEKTKCECVDCQFDSGWDRNYLLLRITLPLNQKKQRTWNTKKPRRFLRKMFSNLVWLLQNPPWPHIVFGNPYRLLHSRNQLTYPSCGKGHSSFRPPGGGDMEHVLC